MAAKNRGAIMDNLHIASNISLPPNLYSFGTGSGEVARISQDGIMRFTVEANDENAARFVKCIEGIIKTRLTGIEVSEKSA
jgi:hypothetical protein